MDELDNVLDFCNKYLMLKILWPKKSDAQRKNSFSFENETSVKKRTTKGQRFEYPTKKINALQPYQKQQDQQTAKPKIKKKKFQAPTKSKASKHSQQIINAPTHLSRQQNEYVPIQTLLQLGSRSNKNNFNNNFESFGNNQNCMNKNSLNSKISHYNYKNNSSFTFKEDYSRNEIMNSQLNRNMPYYNNSPLNRNYERSQFYYESPVRYINQNIGGNFYVPASRSRSPLGNSKSCTNLSLSPQNKTQNDSSLSKKKKKNEKSFYLPTSSSNANKHNMQNSRITSTNNIISKLERQAAQHLNEQMKNEKMGNEKSRTTETRFETKTNRKQMQLKQIDDCSIIQLDSGIREPLSYLSQARGPPRPILIQMKK